MSRVLKRRTSTCGHKRSRRELTPITQALERDTLGWHARTRAYQLFEPIRKLIGCGISIGGA